MELADAVMAIGRVEVSRALRHGTVEATVTGIESLPPGKRGFATRLEAWRTIRDADEDALRRELSSDRRTIPGPIRQALVPLLDAEPDITPQDALWRLQQNDDMRRFLSFYVNPLGAVRYSLTRLREECA